ncbi:sigma-54 dependent transcriptional regulator [Myxococcota bacterium]|nr:sigma-54 dependent transcriptional regulator [Myxococcota bacterium]
MAVGSKGRILIVDDSIELARLLVDQLTDAGYIADLATSGEEAIELAQKRIFDAVLTDLRMEKVDGFDVLEGIHAIDPSVPVLIMTAFGAIDSAIEAIKRGAYHYLTKPFPLQEVLVYVERAIADRRLKELHRARDVDRDRTVAMVTVSDPMKGLVELVGRVASSDASVLIRGETGSGKELIARSIHSQSARRQGPFVAVNCAALPETLLESELFGHVRGAFSGAATTRPGLFVEANEGTLFLDEIGDMPLGLQAKLLRALEGGEVRAVGADAARRVDVRLITATHQDLEQRVREGAFRADLFYRIDVARIRVPPLRERTADIPKLVDHFLARARASSPAAKVERFSNDLLAALARYSWPGNVRELENLVSRLVIASNKKIADLSDLEDYGPANLAEGPLSEAKRKMVTLKELETEYIAWVIQRCGGNKTRAAEVLGIDVSTIHRRERGAAQQS